MCSITVCATKSRPEEVQPAVIAEPLHNGGQHPVPEAVTYVSLEEFIEQEVQEQIVQASEGEKFSKLFYSSSSSSSSSMCHFLVDAKKGISPPMTKLS